MDRMTEWDENTFLKIEKDDIDLNTDGFVRRHHGRLIYIYYVENQSVVIIAGEISGVSRYDFLIDGAIKYIDRQYFPLTKTIEDIPLNKRREIQKKLLKWLKDDRFRYKAYL